MPILRSYIGVLLQLSDQRAPKMPDKERNLLESPAGNRPDKTSAVEVAFGGAVAILLEQSRFALLEKIPVHRFQYM